MVGKFEHFFRVGPVTSNRVTFSWPDQTEFLVVLFSYIKSLDKLLEEKQRKHKIGRK